MNYEEIMLRAISKAGKYKYTAKPNPVVGAILIKDKEIISEGYHVKYGKNHAEINALINADIHKNKKFNEGDVLKAAGWSTPALNKPRGNILEQKYVIQGMRIYGPDYLR